MFARYYGSNLARFLSADPLLASAKASFPQSWSRYSYAFNNPVRFIDPLGLENTVFMVNAAGVDDETMETAQKREGEVVKEEGLSVEVVDEAPETLDDTDKVQVVTTSDKAELKGPGTLENAEVGGQKSEIYVDRIAGNLDTNLGEGTSGDPTAMGNAIGNVGAHAVGHNLGKGHPERSGPIDLSTPEPDVMVSPMTAATLVSDVPWFVAKEE